MTDTQPLDLDLDHARQLTAGYVLGDLSRSEDLELQQAWSDYPTLRREARQLQEVLELLPYALPEVAPPAHLRATILRVLEEDSTIPAEEEALGTVRQSSSELRSVSPRSSLPLTSPRTSPPRPLAYSQPMGVPWGKLMAAVAATVALVLGFDNVRLRQSLQLAQTDPQKVASILQQPNTRLVSLTSTSSDSAAAGSVVFVPGQWQEVVLALGDLPPLPPDQVYRLWLTLDNGTTIPCGEFTSSPRLGGVIVTLNPPETPPPGTKAKGLFVTADLSTSPLQPRGPKLLSGQI